MPRCTPAAPTVKHQDASRRAHLLPLWPHELNDPSPAGRRHRIKLLRSTLRAERQRGLAGHWTYDLARHAALLSWYRAEVSELAGLGGDKSSGPKPALTARTGLTPRD
jgi:hypothetical protein